MKNNFQVVGIDSNQFNYLFELSEEELKTQGAVKMIANVNPGFPCRVTLEDAKIGEEVILFPFEHHQVDSPYQASGPIFIRKNAQTAKMGIHEIPDILKLRFLSLRVYDHQGMMINATTVKGKDLPEELDLIFEDKAAKYIQVHNAKPGCYNCQINRA